MPVVFELDRETRVVHSRAWGAVTEPELMRHVTGIRARFDDGILDATWVQLLDFSDVTSVADLSTADIRHLASVNPWPSTALRVFIMLSPEVYGLGRMYQSMVGAASDRIHIVRSFPAALTLLASQRYDRFKLDEKAGLSTAT